jgi:Tfp pilus assembly protein PilF
VDYYALLGLTPAHLAPQETTSTREELLTAGVISAQVGLAALGVLPVRVRINTPPPQFPRPPLPGEIDAAVARMQQQILLTPGLEPREREALAESYEIARRILNNTRLRGTYDALLRDFHQGKIDGGRLDALRNLQDEARAEIAAERGDPMAPEYGEQLLQQGLGYLDAGLPRQAREALQQAITALPGSAQAHAGFVRAVMATEDLLTAGPHTLRMLLASVAALDSLGAPLDQGAALAALFRGLLARDAGDTAAAEAELRQALAHDGRLVAAWRALAALALTRGEIDECLGACRSALGLDPRDEQALTMMMGAYLRARQRNHAREAAAQIALLRGGGATADAILREVGG